MWCQGVDRKSVLTVILELMIIIIVNESVDCFLDLFGLYFVKKGKVTIKMTS